MLIRGSMGVSSVPLSPAASFVSSSTVCGGGGDEDAVSSTSSFASFSAVFFVSSRSRIWYLWQTSNAWPIVRTMCNACDWRTPGKKRNND